jgi:hypothetical protein
MMTGSAKIGAGPRSPQIIKVTMAHCGIFLSDVFGAKTQIIGGQ